MTKRKDASERKNIRWENVLPHASDIVRSFAPLLITLRQLFYQLVSLPHGHPAKIPNTENYYTTLGRYTAAARRARGADRFPSLIDPSREIHIPSAWDSLPDSLQALHSQYRNHRTDGQQYQIWMASEKKGMVALMRSWFGDDYGVPVIALGGQSSTPYNEAIMARVEDDGRPAILLYAGDHDPAGWRIPHTFVNNTGCWANPELPEYPPTELDAILGYTKPPKKNSKPRPIPNYALDRKFRIALNPEQCDGLTRNAAKEDDPNLQAFLANFDHTLTDDEIDDGKGVQIELDAVNPNDLRAMFEASIRRYWNDDAYQAVLDKEQGDLDNLGNIVENLDEVLEYLNRQRQS